MAAVVVAVGVVVGPWPTDESHYDGSGYAASTFARIDGLKLDGPVGPLRAGVAVADITPPVGEPLAGYGARNPKASRGVLDRVSVKAVSLANGHQTVTIVGGDLLLVTPELRAAVLARTKLPAAEVYFTATHTHSGPGGYSSRWVYEMILGEYDEAIFRRLADALADVIVRSRADLAPARLTVRSEQLAGVVINRSDQSPGHGTLWGVYLHRADRVPLAAVVVFSGHPTALYRDDRRVSGDYPGAVQRAVAERTGAVTLFAAGAVGGMGLAAPKTGDPEQLARLSEGIAAAAAGGFGGADAASATVRLATAILPVDLPPQQYRISENWRLSPIAAGFLHGRRTVLHAVRINDAILLGMPADFSGELAAELERWGARRGLTAAVTSFNGDYVGYLVPRKRYGSGDYEVRGMSLFGPWCGEYFCELARRIMKQASVSR